MDELRAIEVERSGSGSTPSDPMQLNVNRPIPTPVRAYEELLNRDPRWALSEGSQHFEENSAVFKTLHKIAGELNSLRIPYAVIGGMALFRHGLRRFTEDVDILVSRPDLKRIHEKLDGRGYLPPFAKSKHLRDTESGVRIEFLTTGDYPGDGKRKPVSFPVPSEVNFEADGISFIKLSTLIELKLASGMTNMGRLKDLSDVLELIKILELPDGYADQLNPFVQAKFHELWRQSRRRYVKRWRIHYPTICEKSADERSETVLTVASELEHMQKDGVILEADSSDENGSVLLTTYDPVIAAKYGLVDESEYWDMDHND